MEPTIAEVDRRLLGWHRILQTAVETGDIPGELEATEELDRLLDVRLRIPQPRRP